MLLVPKNWVQFQHYKDRCPPWIKLHRDLLNNRDFMRLPIASKALAPMLWLLASESKDGTFDGSKDELMFRLHISSKEYEDGIKPLIDKGFFISADGMLASCLQPATPETERETEKETKKKATSVACPPDVGLQVWQDWLALRKAKKAPVTETVIKSARNEAEKAGISLNAFLTIWCARGSQGLQADWLKPNERQQFVKPQDVIRQTTPTPDHAFDALRKIEQDRKKATPMPANIREKINGMLKLPAGKDESVGDL